MNLRDRRGMQRRPGTSKRCVLLTQHRIHSPLFLVGVRQLASAISPAGLSTSVPISVFQCALLLVVPAFRILRHLYAFSRPFIFFSFPVYSNSSNVVDWWHVPNFIVQ